MDLTQMAVSTLSAEPPPSEDPPLQRGDQSMVGSRLVTPFFSLRLRVAQHITYRLAAER